MSSTVSTARRRGPTFLLLLIAMLLTASLLAPPARASDTVIGFDNLAPGTVVTSQYLSEGVEFISAPNGGGDGNGVPVVRADALASSAPNVASIRSPSCSGEFCENVTWGRFTAARQRVSVRVGSYGTSSENAEVFLFAVAADGVTEIGRATATVTGGAGYTSVLSVMSSTANIRYFVVRTQTLNKRIAIDDLSFDPINTTTPDFGVVWQHPHPPSVLLAPDSTNSTTILVTRFGGSTGPITLSASGLPGGVTASFVPNPVLGSTDATVTLTLTASKTAPPAEYVPVTITGTPSTSASGPAVRSAEIRVTVQLPPPPPPPPPTPFQPNIKWGGRAVAIDVDPGNTQVAVAASESGGLFITGTGGRNWIHVDSLPPFRLRDVRYAPDDGRIIIVSSYADTHPDNRGGIWRSADRGTTWTKPAGSNPPCTQFASTHGIAFAGGGSQDVYVGTDCGLAVSRDLGLTWTHVVPIGADPRVLGVAAQPGGIVDTCGLAGHRRSTNSGATFGSSSSGLTRCDDIHGIAASPVEQQVIFATRNVPAPAGCNGGASAIFEGNIARDGSITWTQIKSATCYGGGRAPWVKTHRSRNGNVNHFDVYFGSGVDVFRQTCTRSTGPGTRCDTTWEKVNVDHADQNDLAFGITVNNCAQYIASDGGIHTTNDCGANWTISGSGKGGFNALQVYEVTGQVHPGGHTDLYFGAQDNGLWASGDSGITWPNTICCEGFFLQIPHSSMSDAGQTITGVACGACFNLKAASHFEGGASGWTNPPGPVAGNPFLISPGVYIQWGQPDPPRSVLYLTKDAGASWSAVATTTETLAGRPIIAGSPTDPIIYQGIRKPGNKVGLRRITGIGSLLGSGVEKVTITAADNGLGSIGEYCMGEGTFVCPVVFGVDLNYPLNLIAADVDTQRMMRSNNGGNSWYHEGGLTSLITAGPRLFAQPNYVQQGPPWNLQPHVIAFNPVNSQHILVGTEAAGIIETLNGGLEWRRVYGSEQIGAITSFFFDEVRKEVIVSSYGRGLWKLPMASLTGAVGETARQPIPAVDGVVAAGFNEPYVQVVGTLAITGQAVATRNDPVTVYGTGFCGAPGCSPVAVAVDDAIVLQGIRVNVDGTFRATFTFTDGLGLHRVSAFQTNPNNALLKDEQLLLVSVSDYRPKQARGSVYLPLVTR